MGEVIMSFFTIESFSRNLAPLAYAIGGHALLNSAIDAGTSKFLNIKNPKSVFNYSLFGTLGQNLTFLFTSVVYNKLGNVAYKAYYDFVLDNRCPSLRPVSPIGEAAVWKGLECEERKENEKIMLAVLIFCSWIVTSTAISLASGIIAGQYANEKLGNNPLSNKDIRNLMIAKAICAVAFFAFSITTANYVLKD